MAGPGVGVSSLTRYAWHGKALQHNGGSTPIISGPPPVTVFLPSLRRRVTYLLREGDNEYLDVVVALLQERCTRIRPGLSLISVGISQALESDRGVPVDTGCSPELTSRLCEPLGACDL